MSEHSIVGDLINFRGLVYAPLNEQGVVFLFGKIAHDLNMYVEEIKPGFPDCIARRFVGRGWERVRIEFEHRSSNFVAHKHDPTDCDVIVCWEHDWKGCPLEVIELSSEIKSLPNHPIERPGSVDPQVRDAEARLLQILENIAAKPEVGKWYGDLLEEMQKLNPEIWQKVGEKYVGWYCPERAFASLRPKKTALQFECFTRGEPLAGTKVSNAKYAPRWGRLTIKTAQDFERALQVLKESYKRIKAAIAEGEPTGYYSGGQGFPTGPSDDSDDDDN
jgi:hypothetical protein